MMTYSYHQHASDAFTINVVPGTKHCGINDDQCKLRYMQSAVMVSDDTANVAFVKQTTRAA